MSPNYRTLAVLVTVTCLSCLLGACTAPQPLVVGEISAEPSGTILVGESATLMIQASGPDLQFQWSAGRGTLASATTSAVIYTAPDSPGPDTVTVEVTGGENTTVRSIAFEVQPRPSPSPTPSPATSAPEATDAPTPTPDVTAPAMAPLTEIFPQVGAGEAFVYINNDGELNYRYVELDRCRHTGAYGLQFIYDMSGDANGGWGVNWDTAPGGKIDASEFSELVFWVRGTSGGETFQIGVKDTDEREVKVESDRLILVSASEWRQVRAPLSAFGDHGVSLASVRNVNFGFNRNHGAGTICIDDIGFE